MTKILIIGQAPPFKQQVVPYDSTMLYDWLSECGITKEQAQDMFEFEAVYDKFPGYKEGGGHNKPNFSQMEKHWPELKKKVEKCEKIWILGNVAAAFLYTKDEIDTKLQLKTIHPSRMNYGYYMKNKEKIISSLKNFLK